MRNGTAWLAGCLLVGAAGCAGPKPTALNYNVLRLSGASEAAVFDAASRALGERFNLNRSDRTAGILEAAPKEGVGPGQSGRLGDVVAVPRRERRVAEMRVENEGGIVKVYCKVLVQEYDTQAHQMFTREHTLNDLPTDTPADRDAATTTDQNSVWRGKRRDGVMEREILQAVREQLGGAQEL